MSETSRGRKDQTNCKGDGKMGRGGGRREKRVFALTKLSANEKQEKDITRRKRCPKKGRKERREREEQEGLPEWVEVGDSGRDIGRPRSG